MISKAVLQTIKSMTATHQDRHIIACSCCKTGAYLRAQSPNQQLLPDFQESRLPDGLAGTHQTSAIAPFSAQSFASNAIAFCSARGRPNPKRTQREATQRSRSQHSPECANAALDALAMLVEVQHSPGMLKRSLGSSGSTCGNVRTAQIR